MYTSRTWLGDAQRHFKFAAVTYICVRVFTFSNQFAQFAMNRDFHCAYSICSLCLTKITLCCGLLFIDSSMIHHRCTRKSAVPGINMFLTFPFVTIKCVGLTVDSMCPLHTFVRYFRIQKCLVTTVVAFIER
jgi:hypothetical protein